MKKLFALILLTLSLQSFAGVQFYKIRPKLISGGTKGYEIKYNADTNTCVKEFWDGSSRDRAQEDVSLRKCQGFIDAQKLKEKNGGNCKSQSKVIDIKTILGVTGKEEIRFSEDCYCYKTAYAVGEDSKDAEFEDLSSCQKAFGKVVN